jgi:hypothetical protein
MDAYLTGGARDIANLKVFIKAEKIDFGRSRYDPDPRMISPRSPIYNLLLGRYIKPLEHRIYSDIEAMFGYRVITKGLNARDTAELIVSHWRRYRHPVCLSLDASRFDQHVNPKLLEWEHSVYKTYFPNAPDLGRLLKMQLKNKARGMVADGIIKYCVAGRRMSGDMNTALGNCLIMVGMTYGLVKGLDVRVVDNGDDCLVITSPGAARVLRQRAQKWYAQFGMEMKIESVTDILERIEFCQSHPVYNGEYYVMVRNYPSSTCKDSISVKPLPTDLLQRRYLRSVGECGLSLTSGIPVVQEFYQAMIRIAGDVDPLTDPSMETGMTWLAVGLNPLYKPPCDEARVSFCMAFGITPAHQVALEEIYENLELGGQGFTEGECRSFTWGPIEVIDDGVGMSKGPKPLWC